MNKPDQVTFNTRTGSFRRIKALTIKEFYQMIRDPSSILISVVLPLILIFVYGFGVSLDLDHLRLGVVMQDNSNEAISLLESFKNSRYFEITTATHERQFQDPITRGNIRGFVVIPPYFTNFYKQHSSNNNPAPIQVIADGSETNTANILQNYVNSTWQTWLAQQSIQKGSALKPITKIESRFWYNEELESRNFLIPGSLAIIMTLIGTLLTALVVAREWERGTMEALIATPVTVVEILIGKLIPYFLLGMFSLVICVCIAVLFYQVPFRGSYLLLGLVSSVFLFSALGIGLFISTIAKNQFAASQAAMVSAFLPSYILSGFLFEISSMPFIIQCITYVIPARYFVSCIQTLFLVGNVWPLILFNLVPMLIVGLLFFLLTVKRMVKRLE